MYRRSVMHSAFRSPTALAKTMIAQYRGLVLKARTFLAAHVEMLLALQTLLLLPSSCYRRHRHGHARLLYAGTRLGPVEAQRGFDLSMGR
ncbi:hypothetical protein BAUCODRAFT_314235 [Baudoinia panamericana UAMH 10762]|uniref:Uncharacterized protein n=1 Tax=Baudoinia panamericana (strain UAMH 10762) TaxID=717646 RepID=M2MXV5_BAUPA|nr:uncharacterized protein BAUCODRAFT_314235 [Baudoinia panamericana UAMH 10762]EMC91090.1 hypothetical protein BAUCODRAFT_314235 [Baudoinia panamericana UAMH 10762]